MLQEALEYLVQQGRDAREPIVTTDAEPKHVYFERQADGSLVRKEAAPGYRAHRASDLTAIAEKAKLAFEAAEVPEVWYSRNGVTLFLDDNRRDRVDLPLSLSKPLVQLIELQTRGGAMRQEQLLKMLRITFRDCLATAGNLVNVVRKVQFGVNQSGESELQHGKQSVGKKLTAELTGTDILPEFFTLTVPVFENPAFASASYGVECALEPDPQTQTFQVIPIPGRIEKAVAEGERRLGIMIGEALAEAGADSVAVFFGTP